MVMEAGDSVIVMGVRGLPRLTDRHEYTEAEIAAATFEFSEYALMTLDMQAQRLGFANADEAEAAMMHS